MPSLLPGVPMFNETAVDYRAGIVLKLGKERFPYTLEFFMEHFVAFCAERAASISKLDPQIVDELPIRGIPALLQASQSLIAGQGEADGAGFKFNINGRTIEAPHNKNAYMYDKALVTKYPESFKESISYIQMARFLQEVMRTSGLSDSKLAQLAIQIILGESEDLSEADEMLPIIIATTLVGEAYRNPSCFIPTLMLFDLIRQNLPTPTVGSYNWGNSLQSDQLIHQHEAITDDNFSAHVHLSLFSSLMGVPGHNALASQEKIPLGPSERAFLNADKKFNKKKNQKEILPSEHLMQKGGYFPQSHLFSYTEIEAHREEGTATLSDKKSFIIMNDWLESRGLATPIHKFHLHKHKGIDTNSDLLKTVIFPTLWENMAALLIGEKIVFKTSVNVASAVEETGAPLSMSPG
jgi:hypothetical protein